MRTLLRMYLVLLLASLPNLVFAGDFNERKTVGNNFYIQKEYDQAIVSYKSALEVAETTLDRATIFSNLGQCYRAKNEIFVALHHFDNALEINPHNRKALYWGIKLRLHNHNEALENEKIISEYLKTAQLAYPAEKLFRVVAAEFEMLKKGDTTVPGVSYAQDFLLEHEFTELNNMFSRCTWDDKEHGSFSGCTFQDNDKNEFELLLGPITERLALQKVLPEGTKQISYTIVRYDRGGFLKQHKDHKKRVDHFVLGISLGGPCDLTFVSDHDKSQSSMCLESNSMFVMENASHDHYSHGISNVENQRFSLLLYLPAPEFTGTRFDLDSKKFIYPKSEYCCEFHRIMKAVVILHVFSQTM